MGTIKSKRIARLRRMMYVLMCSGSSAAILWASVRMAISEPLYALVIAVGLLIIAAARMDLLILSSESRDATRNSAGSAHTRSV